jgi:hypothetical protein
MSEAHYLQPQIKAIKLAIETLTEKRRQYASGHVAYTRQKIRPVEIKDTEVRGTGFAWVESDHKRYVEYDEAIRQLEDMIEIITDPGVTVEAEQMVML